MSEWRPATSCHNYREKTVPNSNAARAQTCSNSNILLLMCAVHRPTILNALRIASGRTENTESLPLKTRGYGWMGHAHAHGGDGRWERGPIERSVFSKVLSIVHIQAALRQRPITASRAINYLRSEKISTINYLVETEVESIAPASRPTSTITEGSFPVVCMYTHRTLRTSTMA